MAKVAAAILGTGSYVPEKKLPNEYFEKILDTSDEWITSRTGIRCRRVAADNQVTSDLCVEASTRALDDAGMKAEDLDLIIVATLTPDYQMPSTACMVQNKLGLGSVGTAAFDLNAACSGYVYALSTAKAFVETGMVKNALVVGGEVLSRVMDYTDRTVSILFGDGAGATVVGRAGDGTKSHRLGLTRFWADGRGYEQVIIPGGGSVHPATHGSVDAGLHYVRVQGKEVFRFGVTKIVDMVQGVMAECDVAVEDIGRIIPHQANNRILESAAERLEIPSELFYRNLADYGNTSGASIPLALDEAARSGALPEGKKVILVGFGSGLTWASAVIDW